MNDFSLIEFSANKARQANNQNQFVRKAQYGPSKSRLENTKEAFVTDTKYQGTLHWLFQSHGKPNTVINIIVNQPDIDQITMY